MQVPPCTFSDAATDLCTLTESQFASWPQLDKLILTVINDPPNGTAGRHLLNSVAATAAIGDIILSEYQVRPFAMPAPVKPPLIHAAGTAVTMHSSQNIPIVRGILEFATIWEATLDSLAADSAVGFWIGHMLLHPLLIIQP